MNERILELLVQSGLLMNVSEHRVSELDPNIKKFAELIVRECAAKAWWAEQYNMGDGVPISKQIEQHFGIEPNIVYKMECFNCSVCGLQNPTTSCGLPNCGFFAY